MINESIRCLALRLLRRNLLQLLFKDQRKLHEGLIKNGTICQETKGEGVKELCYNKSFFQNANTWYSIKIELKQNWQKTTRVPIYYYTLKIILTFFHQ